MNGGGGHPSERGRRAAWLVAMMALMTAPSLIAGAQTASLDRRVAIETFDGPQGELLQGAVEAALLRRYYLVPGTVVGEALRRSSGPRNSDQTFAEAGKRLNVAAFVSAKVRHRGNWWVEMVVRNGDTGEEAARFALTKRRLDALAKALARSTPGRLDGMFTGDTRVAAVDDQFTLRTIPPSLSSRQAIPGRPKEGTPPPAAGADDDDEQTAASTTPAPLAGNRERPERREPPERPDEPAPDWEVGVGGRLFSRSMSFSDNVSRIPNYRLNQASAAIAEAAIYPLQAWGGGRFGAWRSLGLGGNVTYAPGVSTMADDGISRASTAVHGYGIDLRYRVRLGSVLLVPRAGWSVDTFSTDFDAPVPDVSYHVVRVGTAVQIAVSRHATLGASMDYLDVLSVGRLGDGDRFPRATVRGIDVSLRAGYEVTDGLEIWTTVGVRRYGFDMKAQPGDRLIVGGAIDEYASVAMGLTYRPRAAPEGASPHTLQ
ncbi:MAG: hypothetical protein QOI66_2849 [Myxococcales bacterium]|jgi:hypothetical protein|nr:hypothetical protein [Myxococcales bacterium]